MKSVSKTAYEIRLDLLYLAFNILQARHLAESGGSKLLSSSPTVEEIITEADKMNDFVSKTR